MGCNVGARVGLGDGLLVMGSFVGLLVGFFDGLKVNTATHGNLVMIRNDEAHKMKPFLP
jgi:hypothetical protein